MTMSLVFTLGALVLFTLLPLPVLYFWKLRKLPHSARVLLAALVLQIACMTALWLAFVADLPSSVAPILLGILLAFSGIGFTIGLLLSPLCYFLAARPVHWRRKSLRTLSAYAIVAVLALTPLIATKLGIGANVELHGKVMNMDGSAVANAIVHFSDCPYIRENPAVSDRDGLFTVTAKCGAYFSVEKIYNPETRTECLSRFSPDSEPVLITFDDLPGEERPGRRPHWQNYGADNPFRFPCVWQRPKTVLKASASLRLDSENPSQVLNLHAVDYDQLMHGDGEIEIGYQPSNRTLVVRALNGAVQATAAWSGSVNIAPLAGYQDHVEVELPGSGQVGGSLGVFFEIRGTYGFVELKYQARPASVELDIEYLFNPDGGVNLVAHDQEQEYLLERRGRGARPVVELEL
jgi:hypothetical protein